MQVTVDADMDSTNVAPDRACPPCPLFIDLSDRRATVVGGGKVAERKVLMLVSYGARVEVIAPQVTGPIRELAESGEIALRQRPYRAGDLAGSFLVIGAVDDAGVNRDVEMEARTSGMLVNIVGTEDHGDTLIPATVRRGSFQLAISTGGASPAFSRSLREELEERFPEWFGDYTDLLASVRQLVQERVHGPSEKRKPLYETLVDGRLQAEMASGSRPTPEEVYEKYIIPAIGEEAR